MSQEQRQKLAEAIEAMIDTRLVDQAEYWRHQATILELAPLAILEALPR